MTDRTLDTRLTRLEERLERIEASLGLEDVAQQVSPTTAAPPTTPLAPTAAAIPRPAATQPVAPPLTPTKPIEPPAVSTPAASSMPSATPTTPTAVPTSRRTTAPKTPPTTRPTQGVSGIAVSSEVDRARPAPGVLGTAAAPRKVKRPKRDRSSLELLIGGKSFAWAGALVIVLAVSFFIKFAYDQGFFSLLTAAQKCLATGVFGLALLGVGELALRRYGRLAATGLFASGLGVLYLTAFASFHYFGIVSISGAFLLLALVAGVGLIVTLRGGMLTIGVLSLLAGYATPMLLFEGVGESGTLPLYLSALFGSSLGLSAYRPKPFRWMRYVSMGGLAFTGFIWAVAGRDAIPSMIIVYLSVWWMMLTGECLLAAMRGQSSIGNPVACILGTAWYVTIGGATMYTSTTWGTSWLSIYLFTIAAVSVAIAAQFGAGVDALRTRPKSAMGRFAVALWLQAAALLPIGLAFQFSGYGIPLSWLIVAVLAVELGRRLPSRGLDVFALVVGGLASLRILMFDAWSSPPAALVLTTISGVQVTPWSLLALAALLAAHVAAHRIRPLVKAPELLALALSALGTFGWVCLMAVHTGGLTLTNAWLVGVVALLLASRISPLTHYLEQAVAVLVLGTLRFVFIHLVSDRFGNGWQADGMLLLANGHVATAVVLAGLFAWCGWKWRRHAPRAWASNLQQALMLVGIGVVLIALNFEIDRVIVQSVSEGGAWTAVELRVLWSLSFWVAAAIAIGLGGQAFRFGWFPEAGRVLSIVGAGLWLTVGTLGLRALREPAGAWIVLNPQFMCGAICLAALGLHLFAERRGKPDRMSTLPRWFGQPAEILIGLLVLWLGSFEIDRLVVQSFAETGAWTAGERRVLWTLSYWVMASVAIAVGGKALRFRWYPEAGQVLAIVSSGLWLTVGTLGLRVLREPAGAWIVLNAQFICGAICLAALGFHLHAERRVKPDRDGVPPLWVGQPASALIVLLVLWLGSFEIDRLIVQRFAEAGAWTAGERRVLWTLAYCIIASVAVRAGTKVFRLSWFSEAGRVLAILGSGLWLTVGTFGLRALREPEGAWILLNAQFICGAICLAAVAFHLVVERRCNPDSERTPPRWFGQPGAVLIGLLGLWLGSFEIDRLGSLLQGGSVDAEMTRLVGFSVYWAVYGIGLVVVGFWKQTAVMRYCGLALLALTLGKVLLIDMAEVQSVYRVASFLAVGLLLVATSVAYSRVAPKLRGDGTPSPQH